MEELFHLLTADQRKQAPQLVEGSQGRMLYDNGQNLQIWLDSEKQEVSIMARLNCSNQIDRDLLTPAASLKNDLEIDSLDFVDIVVLIDREFGFKPKAEELKNVKTLQDFYDYIESHV